MLSVQPGLRGSNGPPRRTKNGDLSIVFSVQGTGCISTWPDPENRVGDQDIGSPGRPVFYGLRKKSPRLNRATQFLTVVYDGACSPNVSIQNGVNFLRRLALQEKKKT